MSDHYEMFGVGRNADKDEIRSVYQSRKDALEGDSSDAARAELGQLNEAWQTLADPYQRGRYDASLENGNLADEPEVVDEADQVDSGADEPPRRRGLFQPSEPRPAQERKPTIAVPPGLRLAENRPRLNAMMFDLAVVILLAVGIQLVGQQVVRNQYPDEVDRIQEISDEVEAIDEEIDRRAESEDLIEDIESDIDAANEAGASTGELEDLLAEEEVRSETVLEENRSQAAELEGDLESGDLSEEAASDAEDELADLDEQAELIGTSDSDLDARREVLVDEDGELRSELQPANTITFAVGVLLGLIYLIGFGLRGGQTFGKRLRKVRVVELDGSPLTLRSAAIRYGLPALFAAVTFMFLLGILGFALALFGVLMWMRSPNGQGLHDRLAGTIVVEDLPGASPPQRPSKSARPSKDPGSSSDSPSESTGPIIDGVD